jgi:hypothetical protein
MFRALTDVAAILHRFTQPTTSVSQLPHLGNVYSSQSLTRLTEPMDDKVRTPSFKISRLVDRNIWGDLFIAVTIDEAIETGPSVDEHRYYTAAEVLAKPSVISGWLFSMVRDLSVGAVGLLMVVRQRSVADTMHLRSSPSCSFRALSSWIPRWQRSK